MNFDEIARSQFRLDTNCSPETEELYRIMINERKELPGARRYAGLSTFFMGVFYKGDAYIMADPEILPWIREKYEKAKPEWFCKFENLRMLDEELKKHGHKIADTHVYFLPDEKIFSTVKKDDIKEIPTSRQEASEIFGDDDQDEIEGTDLKLIWFYDKEIAEFRIEHRGEGKDGLFPHSLVYSETQPDRIAVAAVDKGKLVAMTGASEDGKYLWQIGVDIDPEYEGMGLATYLTEKIASRVLTFGKLPFYGTSESHSLSMDVAIRAGFIPAWAEVVAST
ncbi:Acetyltransferase (GNAT) family protein [Lachnospiraceae bacterium]|nr:Acetyltransferase (GNAT) family protein [Lachnospiraceae bacterium]